MSEREQNALAWIERHLAATDPRLARMLSAHRHPGHSAPMVLLQVGLAAMVLGSLLTALPLVVLGMSSAFVALGMAAFRSGGPTPRLTSG